MALGTTQKSSFFTKFLTHQTGNYPVTCFVSKPSRITLVVLSIIYTSYQKSPFGAGDYPDDTIRVAFWWSCLAVVVTVVFS